MPPEAPNATNAVDAGSINPPLFVSVIVLFPEVVGVAVNVPEAFGPESVTVAGVNVIPVAEGVIPTGVLRFCPVGMARVKLPEAVLTFAPAGFGAVML